VAVVEGVAAGVTAISVVAFLGYLVALFRSPSSGRPRTPVYNRFGEELPPEENPGYKETEDEQH
jgi:hypothetical protein